MILQNDKQDRSKFSSKVREGVCIQISIGNTLHGINRGPFQGLRKLLLYAKTKHAKNYPWMRYIQEAVVARYSILTTPLSFLATAATQCGLIWLEVECT